MADDATIHRATIQISRPMGDDPGTIETSNYVVEGGVVVLTDSAGKAAPRDVIERRKGDPIMVRWERKISPGEDHGRAARELLWTRYRATRRGYDSRPISMKKWGSVA